MAWRAPLAPQGALAKYWVTVSQGGNLVREESVSPDMTVFSLDWLVEGEEYTVTVAAENQEQRSSPSEQIVVRLRAGKVWGWPAVNCLDIFYYSNKSNFCFT